VDDELGLPDGGELAPGSLIGEFRVEYLLGQGGMGRVYAATHPLIGKKAAIKIINAGSCTDMAAVKRFVQEARVVNEIRHPNIVDVFSFGRLDDGRTYFVMEWLQGMTLAARAAMGRIPLGECVSVLEQICDALEAAHEKGIVHRDLKPDNVFLVPVRGRPDQVKLLDFGIAKLLGDRDPKLTHESSNTVMGTPDYISPEQARGKDVDHRTDIYALGCMAYEIVLGHCPYSADNIVDLLQMHLHAPPPLPRSEWPDIPQAVDWLLPAMIAKDSRDRPTLAAIRQALSEVKTVISSGTVAPLSQTSMPLPAVKHTRAVAIGVVGGFLLAGGIVILAMRHTSTPPASVAQPLVQPKAEPIVQPPVQAPAPPPATAAPVPIAPTPIAQPQRPAHKPISRRAARPPAKTPVITPSAAPAQSPPPAKPPSRPATDKDYVVDPFGGNKLR
jgi:serine/threonine-protein kinase